LVVSLQNLLFERKMREDLSQEKSFPVYCLTSKKFLKRFWCMFIIVAVHLSFVFVEILAFTFV